MRSCERGESGDDRQRRDVRSYDEARLAMQHRAIQKTTFHLFSSWFILWFKVKYDLNQGAAMVGTHQLVKFLPLGVVGTYVVASRLSLTVLPVLLNKNR